MGPKRAQNKFENIFAFVLAYTNSVCIVRGMKEPKQPLFQCLECGKKFYSVGAAERASFGDNGCPGCGGSDIDACYPSYTPHHGHGNSTNLFD